MHHSRCLEAGKSSFWISVTIVDDALVRKYVFRIALAKVALMSSIALGALNAGVLASLAKGTAIKTRWTLPAASLRRQPIF